MLVARRPGWRGGNKLWLATARGLRWAGLALRPARLVTWRLSDDLALVDLSEHLLAKHAGSSWLTERELRSAAVLAGHQLDVSGRVPDGLFSVDGERYAVELDLSRKDRERLDQVISGLVMACRGKNALAGVWWYCRRDLLEQVDAAVRGWGAEGDIEVRSWP